MQVIRRIYSVLAALTFLDLILIWISPSFRDVAGQAEGWRGTAIRSAPDLVLFGVLGWASQSRLRGEFTLTLSIIFGAFSIVMLLPWIGMFAALLTPISLLYFAAILWIPHGFSLADAVAVVFLVLNASVALFSVREMRNNR